MSAPRLPGGPVTVPGYRTARRLLGAGAGLAWRYFGSPVPANYSLRERPGYLRLHGVAPNLGLFATGNGQPTPAPADFAGFDYLPGK